MALSFCPAKIKKVLAKRNEPTFFVDLLQDQSVFAVKNLCLQVFRRKHNKAIMNGIF